MPSPSDETGQHEPAPDTAQIPVARDDTPPAGKPAHAARSGRGITRAGWWAITVGAAALLILGFLLTFGPARYWTPVPVVFLGYFLISGLIGLVFWKGVRELQDSDPNLRTDDPAPTGQRVAAAISAVGIASALILLPVGLSDAPANAAPCPDGSQTCGPQPTQDPGPTQGNGGNTTAPQAPNTTVPPDTNTGLMPPPAQGNGSGFQGTARPMPTPDQTDPNACILNCGPTQQPQAPQAPQTGQANPPQTAENPVATAPNTVATTPQAPKTTTPQLRTPTPETTTSTTSSKARDRDENRTRSSDEDRDKNSGIPYQAAELASVIGTYRRKKTTDTAVRSGQVVSENATRALYTNATRVSKPVQLPGPGGGGRIPDPNPGNNDPGNSIRLPGHLAAPRDPETTAVVTHRSTSWTAKRSAWHRTKEMSLVSWSGIRRQAQFTSETCLRTDWPSPAW
ncbi:cytochrome b/b6 domain-containing protein [Tsukamurella sp. PLM1]|uniref:cytochrome b/b6 domain-containing protein n=1 Tax=Tsukamurella sp. PLM1 TaxID=2929795 RepID=UPI00205D982B|nr:cytochrome b/b6 domain-containing protein [Tsukamurella sp. PLM1]BDH56479.1 hypothetical protein MTP03_14180 [Tsukamurella sp. PLM1]